MTISQHFEKTPDRPALITVETGEVVTYRELEIASRQLASVFELWGFVPGERIVVFMDNRAEFFVALWAGLRMGLRVVPVNRFLKAEEASYIIENSDARAVFVSDTLGEIASQLPTSKIPLVEHFVVAGEALEGFTPLDEVLAMGSQLPPPERPLGATMFYTSGTTGRPKGTVSELSGRQYSEGLGEMASWIEAMMNFQSGDSLFVPAPLYHAASCFAAISAQATGGTVLMMKKFDAVQALEAMQHYRVTHSYLVPTMFLRMLKLPLAKREIFDPSSLISVLHTGEPCPPQVKHEMIEWWGPKFIDMYGASELPQGTLITSEEWLLKPGSVGRPFDCTIHIVDEAGNVLPTGQTGMIFIESPTAPAMTYHKDASKTAEIHNTKGWLTVGDIGYLDEDGYLFLTDRKDHMVISGGVNIYPRESEVVLLTFHEVLDAVSFGLPDPDMGERLVSVVQLRPEIKPGPELAQRLIEHCRTRIAHYKCPKEVFFEAELPRLPTGKIYKHEIRDAYLARAKEVDSQ